MWGLIVGEEIKVKSVSIFPCQGNDASGKSAKIMKRMHIR